MKWGWLSRVESGLLVSCAVTLTGVFVYRELFRKPDVAPAVEIRRVPGWRAFATSGHRVGPADAPVSVVEFSDFQCPFCAAFDSVMRSTLKKHRLDVARVYRHFPITQIHPYAMEAAVAAECAADQQRFEAYHDVLLDHQRLIGSRTWLQFASDAGVPDTVRFERCLSDTLPKGRIRDDLRAAMKLGVTGTPGILINDQFIDGAPSSEVLEEYILAALRTSRLRPSK